jgi:glyoxylase-like metal-dependent hydrolase (beta-lactamase superfamily II)
VACACLMVCAAPAAEPPPGVVPPIEYYRLVKGFLAESKNDAGFADGTGFKEVNPWGQYTAYLMSTNSKGQRTFRIEHYLPVPGSHFAQGSSMYLLEGSRQALLIDTGNPARSEEGVSDLKTVVRYLLSHDDKGDPKSTPLDFVVANTHSHGDHTGENGRMNDRIVYYMDGDWPTQDVPKNYVPIREGGGRTTHGLGTAVGDIDLGNRLIKAVAVPPHTPGSTGYLDVENQMFISGDALGSAWPCVQMGPLTQYATTLRHVEEITRNLTHLAVLPAHFYQTAAWARGMPPLNGRALDRQYILDEIAVTDGVLAGTIPGEAFFAAGRGAAWAKVGSGQVVYSLEALYSAGENPRVPYHAIRIPGDFPAKWVLDQTLTSVFHIKAEFYLIRGAHSETLYLLIGSRAALLIAPAAPDKALETLIGPLTHGKRLEVALMSGRNDSVGGFSELAAARVYAASNELLKSIKCEKRRVHNGAMIDLGYDTGGHPLRLEAHLFTIHGRSKLTLLDESDRIMFSGDALGMQGADGGITLGRSDTDIRAALAGWRRKTDGKYDLVYTSGNYQWFTSAIYVDEFSQAIERAAVHDAQHVKPSTVHPGFSVYTSDGSRDVVASVLISP